MSAAKYKSREVCRGSHIHIWTLRIDEEGPWHHCDITPVGLVPFLLVLFYSFSGPGLDGTSEKSLTHCLHQHTQTTGGFGPATIKPLRLANVQWISCSERYGAKYVFTDNLKVSSRAATITIFKSPFKAKMVLKILFSASNIKISRYFQFLSK